jgi:hypothetical protein
VTRRDVLAQQAVLAALRFRARRGRVCDQPVCPIDLALEEGVEVRLSALTSLEGMYAPEGPAIVLGSLRPAGRRAYNAAHELGHHEFGHGLRVDELLGREPAARGEAEFVADRFGAALVMPKVAVMRSFSVRAWTPETATPAQAFAVAGELGVGYSTLIGYLAGTLGMIRPATSERLRKTSPKAIRAALAGRDHQAGVVVVDRHWYGRAVDVEVGDLLLVDRDVVFDGPALKRLSPGILRARAPGVAHLARSTGDLLVRVMRRGYTGLAIYRHFEEANDDT